MILLSKAVFYQAVQLPIKSHSNYNTVNDECVPGVRIEMNEHLVFVSHDDWKENIVVPTANLRFAVELKAIQSKQPIVIEQVSKKKSVKYTK